MTTHRRIESSVLASLVACSVVAPLVAQTTPPTATPTAGSQPSPGSATEQQQIATLRKLTVRLGLPSNPVCGDAGFRRPSIG